jgi:hypothetical protein
VQIVSDLWFSTFIDEEMSHNDESEEMDSLLFGVSSSAANDLIA